MQEGLTPYACRSAATSASLIGLHTTTSKAAT
jgi:hypothetical protein